MPALIDRSEIRFGAWYGFRDPAPWRPRSDLYAATLEHIAHAETLGLDDAWTSERHFIEDGYSALLLPLRAAIAARTTRVRVGANVLLLPLHDPLRLGDH